MSIPKEPRQLMINLMYLVLTALLALNISAEVMNAFFTLDKGIQNSNVIVDSSNSKILASIAKQADAYKNPQNEAFYAAAQKSDSLTKEFVLYIDDLRKRLFDAAGGPSPKNPLQPKRIKDKDVTTRLFVHKPPQGENRGPELENKILEVRKGYMEIAGNDPTLPSLPLEISEDWKKSDKKSWSDFTFMQMPVAAIFPVLRKIENDARASNAAVLNFLFEKISGEDIKFDAFEPVVSASKGYVIKGEKYAADVFLSAFSTKAGDNTRILVNGSSLPVKDGKASYETGTSQIGTKKYSVEIQVINPLTQEVKSYKKEFEYEVGERSITVSADKMNVFYIGVENPVSVSAAGVSSNDMQVNISGGGGKIRKVGSANYIVEVTTPTLECFVSVSASSIGLSDKKLFRVKRIPDPVARLGKESSGSMGNGEFKAQPGVGAFLDNFDFDAKCAIQSFTVTKVPPRQDAIVKNNEGPRYNGDVSNLVNSAKPGDTYYFDEVKARCPGDQVGRKINSMVFKIR
ncbi:MAG: hypothetical protein KA479_07965 [Saprospiraceae bacterium]|nr:hypothetical protein [Saprospiraceae bacterium]